MRVRWKGFALSRPDGTPFDLIDHLTTMRPDANLGEVPSEVLVHARVSGTERLYAHLILALLCDDLSQEFLESSPSGRC